MTKSDLRARPIFHRQKDSIDAHLTVVFAAWAIGRHLQELTGWPLKKLVKSLEALRDSRVLINRAEMTFDAHVPADLEPVVNTLLEGHETEARDRPEFRQAARENLSKAKVSVDHFHVIQRAYLMITQVRRRRSHEVHERRGRATDPAYRYRKLLTCNLENLSIRQVERLKLILVSDPELRVIYKIKEHKATRDDSRGIDSAVNIVSNDVLMSRVYDVMTEM